MNTVAGEQSPEPDGTKREMHEEVPRGNGGEISLANSKMICRTCHRTSDRAHGNRRPQWNSKSFEEVMEGE